jgi:hypothetical protein
MTYRRSGSLWSLLRAIFTARAAGRSRRRPPPLRAGQGRAPSAASLAPLGVDGVHVEEELPGSGESAPVGV